MADNNPRKNERNYKYKENHIIEVNSMHGVSEYEPKRDTFELSEKKMGVRGNNVLKNVHWI